MLELSCRSTEKMGCKVLAAANTKDVLFLNVSLKVVRSEFN